jgi:hypothetical protein
MKQVAVIGIDLAKNVFQVHGTKCTALTLQAMQY